jgi:hypothetical protein
LVDAFDFNDFEAAAFFVPACFERLDVLLAPVCVFAAGGVVVLDGRVFVLATALLTPKAPRPSTTAPVARIDAILRFIVFIS